MTLPSETGSEGLLASQSPQVSQNSTQNGNGAISKKGVKSLC